MTLSAANRDARSTAAQVVAAIAHIELPRHLWADLIQVLLSNMQQENDHLKQATLEAIGYICEEIVCLSFIILLFYKKIITTIIGSRSSYCTS
jgi:hypothetical protein